MSNLKWVETNWEHTGKQTLMFVEFDKDGRKYKWYPKWEELADILYGALGTEGVFNNGRLKDYLTFICLQPIFRELSVLKCTEEHYDGEYMELIKKFNDLTDGITQNLLNKQAGK